MTERRILIVEDEPDVANYEKEIVEAMGCSVIGISATGEEGIDVASKERPDLVIMDFSLKGRMNGVDAACEIIEEHGIPVIFVSAYGPGGKIDHNKTRGVVGYIVKPFIKDNLEKHIEFALS